MQLNWPNAGRFKRRGFETGRGKAMPMNLSPTSNLDATCVLNGGLRPSRTGGKSAGDDWSALLLFLSLSSMLT